MGDVKMSNNFILKAIENHDLETTLLLLKEGCDCDKLLANGMTPLGFSCQTGALNLVEVFIRRNHTRANQENKMTTCDINLLDAKSMSPLHYAVQQNNIEIVILLLNAGCFVDILDKDGMTPLHMAVMRGNHDVVQVLVDFKAKVNLKTLDKISPLHMAASHGFASCVKILLNAGAKIDAIDSSDRTPLYLAVYHHQYEVVRLLMKNKCKVNIEDIHGYSPICEAVWAKDLNMVEILLKGSAVIVESHYLLHFAVLHCDIELIRVLLSTGCQLNFADDQGNTPLILACYTAKYDVIELFVKLGANVNHANNLNGITPLHACIEGVPHDQVSLFTSMLRILIQHGVNLNQESFTKCDTPFYRSITSCKNSFTDILIKFGCDINSACFHSCNVDPLNIVFQQGHIKTGILMIKAGYKLSITMCNKLRANHQAYKSILYYEKNPLNLCDLCRIVIRRCINKANIMTSINKLKLPLKYTQFLALQNLSL